MRLLPTLGLALFSLSALSCRTCTDPEPETPPCISGVVVGDACLDGLLIDVDPAFAIGQPAGSLGQNVIAAVNFADLASFKQVGTRVYFNYRNDPSQQRADRVCTANTTPLPVPHLLLGGVSATGCAATPR